MVSLSKILIFRVVCIAVIFNSGTHAYDVSNPVCKWNSAKSTCENDPSKMIELLTKSGHMFGLLMRCQYATKQSTCDNMSQNTCIWENNNCRILSKKLISQINECFSTRSCSYLYNNQNCCQDELQIIYENTTWIDRNFFPTAPSCKDIVGCFPSCQDIFGCFSNTKNTCKIMKYVLQCYLNSNCRYNSNTIYTYAYQLVSDLHQIFYNASSIHGLFVFFSSDRESNPFYFLESNLGIKSGNLQLYDSCNNIKSSYRCQCQTSQYQQCPKTKTNIALIVVPSVLSALFLSICCCIMKRNWHVVTRNLLIIRRYARNATQTMRTSENVQLATSARTITEQQRNNFETAETVEIIESLPNLEFKGNDDSEAICCICLESLQGGEPSTVLPCAHWFHKECLNKWIRTKGRNVSCPLCNNILQNTQQQQQ